MKWNARVGKDEEWDGGGGFNDGRLFAIDTVCESKLAIRYREQIFLVRKCCERGKKEIATNIGLSTLQQHKAMYVQSNIKACLHSFFSHPTSKSHPFATVLYCHLWPVCINHIFQHYLIFSRTAQLSWYSD